MTEEQAKEKWCPMARFPQTTTEPSPSSNYGQNCIGAACMMWRWAERPNPEWRPERYSLMQEFPPRDSRFDPPIMICHDTEGYCGIAGRAGALAK